MGDTDKLLVQLMKLRQQLHREPDLSGYEERTARTLHQFLSDCNADEIHDSLGGHGIAAIFHSQDRQEGPKVMLRAELDALPLSESIETSWNSQSPGCAHKCGHDGHMAILAGVARRLQQKPPSTGSVILLFQPAEETGTGAKALLSDSRFQALRPDWVFALHNLPGYPAWNVLTRDGAFAAGSAGVKFKLTGTTSHAAYPEQGQSPDLAMAQLVTELINLTDDPRDGLALITVVHARLGQENFGVSPGDAEIMATIRADQNSVLNELKIMAAALGKQIAAQHGLNVEIEFCEEFPVTKNTLEAVNIITLVANELDLEIDSPGESPFRWSEDFGYLIEWAGLGAMFGLGAGTDHAVLHGPRYDFNDDLILPGLTIMEHICRKILDHPA